MKLLLLIPFAWAAFAADADGDGLDDAFEQQLIQRFAPRLMLSQGECDLMPARFAPDEPEPRALERDGTLYAKATPWAGAEGAWIEIHYYHLWANDCGRLAHPLDVERVSVLLRAPAMDSPAEDWRAVYWYAAAHEATVCDGTHGARANWLKAETHGATVFVSRGKHATYLARNRCGKGCGGDVCKPLESPLVPPAIVNLGEPGRPLNGSLWIASRRWPLLSKMETDFGPAAFARLENHGKNKPAGMNGGIIPLQSVVLGGEHTLRSLETAGAHTDNSLQKAQGAVGESLKKSVKAVGRFLRGGAK